MNRLLMLGTALLMAVVLAVPVAVARRTIVLEQTDKPVVFDHAKHVYTNCESCHGEIPYHFPAIKLDMSISCVTCHHLVDGKEPMTYQCSSCHSNPDPRYRGNGSLFAMAHARDPLPGTVSCLSCHYEVANLRPELRVKLTACSGSSCHP